MTSEIAKQFRSQKTSLGFSPGARPDAYIRHSDDESRAQVEKLKNQISRMAQVGTIQVLDASAPDPQQTMRDVVNEKCLIYTKVEGLDLSGEKAKLQKKVSWLRLFDPTLWIWNDFADFAFENSWLSQKTSKTAKQSE